MWIAISGALEELKRLFQINEKTNVIQLLLESVTPTKIWGTVVTQLLQLMKYPSLCRVSPLGNNMGLF